MLGSYTLENLAFLNIVDNITNSLALPTGPSVWLVKGLHMCVGVLGPCPSIYSQNISQVIQDVSIFWYSMHNFFVNFDNYSSLLNTK